MNRQYLLDSLDGFKGLVFRLLGPEISGQIACVSMTTDGPWSNEEKAIFQQVIGIPGERTYWTPGDFENVPPANDREARSAWVTAIASIDHRYLFLDPDTGFYSRHTGNSTKVILISELAAILEQRDALIVYRHQYWPKPRPANVPEKVYPYV